MFLKHQGRAQVSVGRRIFEVNCAGRRRDQPRHESEQRRLSASTRTDNAHELAAGDVERHVLERDNSRTADGKCL